jgi:hypothetical protein
MFTATRSGCVRITLGSFQTFEDLGYPAVTLLLSPFYPWIRARNSCDVCHLSDSLGKFEDSRQTTPIMVQ